MLVNNKNNLTKDVNQHIIEIYQQANVINDTRKERKIMLEIEKRVLKTLVKEMPGMTTYEKGYLPRDGRSVQKQYVSRMPGMRKKLRPVKNYVLDKSGICKTRRNRK